MADEKKDKKSFKEIINNLSKTERMLAYAAGFFVILTLLDRMVLAPILNKTRSVDDQIRQEKIFIRDGLLILGYKEKIDGEFEALRTYFTESKRTDEEELASFLKDMENLAVNSGIRIISISPTGNIETAKLYTKYEIKLDCAGSMDNIMKFLYSIGVEDKMIKVQSIEIVPPQKEGEDVKCTMMIIRTVVGL